MTNWKFYEPEDETGETSLVTVLSEEEILDMYYDFWKMMMEKIGKGNLVSKENCIQDWVIVHWASKTDEPVGVTRVKHNNVDEN